jgi:dTDP-glucose pyrophosphorylase
MLVRQGLIPAAGSGTRLGPFTNAIPKELLPVGDKAVIEHVVESMVIAGISDIVIVVAPHKHGLSDYLGSGKRFGVTFTYVVQDERLGLANAVAAGEHVLMGTFAVVLGDNFFAPKQFLADLVTAHAETGAVTTVGGARVEDGTRHGIHRPDGDRVADMIEKPSAAEAPGNLGALGAYIFEREIFDAIRATLPGHRGEYQLTDAIRIQVQQGKDVRYREIAGIHIDVGTPQDLMRANQWYLRESSNPGTNTVADRRKDLEEGGPAFRC